jgi:serine/threonine protein kinase
MWSSKQIALDEIGLKGVYTIPQIPSIELSRLPSFKSKALSMPDASIRTLLQLQSQIDHGSYGNLYTATRGEKVVLVKQPRMAEINLLQEAVLQHLAHKALEAEGMSFAVPKVYDVFWKDKEVWFSMERIYGMSLAEWFFHSKSPDSDTYCLLAQLCLILSILELYLNLDHRDLKHSNLVLKPEACSIQVKLNHQTWSLHCPFTVVLLDFGFACLGSERLQGKPLVNLGDGVLPPMDPCPKEGRDMFHLLVSLLGLPVFRQSISPGLHAKIDAWLAVGTKSYGPMARRWSTEHWSYLVSSQPNFSIPNCCPLSILKDLLPELKGSLACS